MLFLPIVASAFFFSFKTQSSLSFPNSTAGEFKLESVIASPCAGAAHAFLLVCFLFSNRTAQDRQLGPSAHEIAYQHPSCEIHISVFVTHRAGSPSPSAVPLGNPLATVSSPCYPGAERTRTALQQLQRRTAPPHVHAARRSGRRAEGSIFNLSISFLFPTYASQRSTLNCVTPSLSVAAAPPSLCRFALLSAPPSSGFPLSGLTPHVLASHVTFCFPSFRASKGQENLTFSRSVARLHLSSTI